VLLPKDQQNSCPLGGPLILPSIKGKNVIEKNRRIWKRKLFEINEDLTMLINRQYLLKRDKRS